MNYNPLPAIPRITHAPKKSNHPVGRTVETMHNLLIFGRFQSIFSMTVWNTIDDRYSIFPLYRNEATFLAFAPFSEHFQYDSVEYYR